MKCGKCKYWGDGDGTGWPYDAGHVNHCNHPQITGDQHPSYGICGEPKSMLIVDGGGHPHRIMTRITFGCVLGESINESSS